MSRKPVSKGETLAAAMNETRDQSEALAAVSGLFSRWRPARQVLTRVRGVRTIFPSIDMQTKIGGWPIERVALVHGESNQGKSELVLGLGKSFLDLGHFFAFVDAEMTTPETWLRQLSIPVDSPGFFALRPKTYEETVDAVREWAETIGNLRAQGKIDPKTTGICAIDSIGKLAPKDLLKKIAKEQAEENEKKPAPGGRAKPKRGIDGMGGRAAQYKAALNNAWMNELVPLMASTGCAIVIITREIEDPDAGMFDEGVKTTGGKSLVYDSSLVVRVTRDAVLWRGEGTSREMVGERRRVEIRKTKIGRKEDKIPRAYFNSSNGVLVPAGFDTARDYLDVGQELGVVELNGSFYVLGKKRIGQGEHNAVKRLHEDRALFRELEEAVRASIAERLAKEPGAVAPGIPENEDVPESSDPDRRIAPPKIIG